MTLIEMQSNFFHPTIHIIFRSVVKRRKKHRDSDRDAELLLPPYNYIIFKSVVKRRKKYRDSDRDAELPLPPYNSHYFQECG